MFNQNNNEEKKLDWMYKGPNSTVDREEYLLGRSVDKTLEQLNDEEKQKQQGLITIPKNRVEHECIPPSIRDFNKLVQAEQVDLSTKLQEDPLVAIKKREEETRRQFLQNPVQLKKLQKALKAQQAKKKKKKKKSKESDNSEDDLEVKLTERLLGPKNKISKEERDLDTILIHKFEALKDKLTDDDIRDILNGKITDSDDSSEEENDKRKIKSRRKRRDSSEESDNDKRNIYKKEQSEDYRKRKSRNQKERGDYRKNERRGSSEESEDGRKKKNYNKERRDRRRGSSDEDSKRRDRRRGSSDEDSKRRDRNYRSIDSRNERKKVVHRNRSQSPQRRSSSSESDHHSRTKYYSKTYDSDDSDSPKSRKVNYGLVSSDGKKIPFAKKDSGERKRTPPKSIKASVPPPPVHRNRSKKLTDEEKEKLRQEMMKNAVWRDRERERNVRKYRETEEKERNEQDFDPEFVNKQLLKSANSSSVESRIKANLNNIQRSGRDMDKHFSRR